MVVYKNGESEIFKDVDSDKLSKGNLRRHRINADILAFAYNGPIYFSYEIIRSDGKLGYEIPVNFNHTLTGSNPGLVGISTGLNLKYYLKGEGKGFFVGPSLAVGSFDYAFVDENLNTNEGAGLGIIMGGKIGGQFQLTDTFGLSTGGTLGYYIPFTDGVSGDVSYSIYIGFNFSF